MPKVALRQELIDHPGHELYEDWKNDPITKKVVAIIMEESRAVNAIASDPNVGAAMYHHRVGVDWVLAIMTGIDVTDGMTDIEAKYGPDDEQQGDR
jgi:hypothetical protein